MRVTIIFISCILFGCNAASLIDPYPLDYIITETTKSLISSSSVTQRGFGVTVEHIPFEYKTVVNIHGITIKYHSRDHLTTIDTTLSIVCYLPDKTIKIISNEMCDWKKISNDDFVVSFPFDMNNRGLYGFVIATKYEIGRVSKYNYSQSLTLSQTLNQ